ncbi:hypothetical protein H8D79_00425 [PVC group bacterium]|nr:hypothetical protein [PVC group bacterium]
MALTKFQRSICLLIAENRLEQGESYVAGGAALNALVAGHRVSHDIDLFHDTREALEATWDSDCALLERNGYALDVIRERPAFVEAIVSRGEERVLMQWTCDSAYRFFPLVQHDEFGLVLHPFDLATNKVLALVGRLEVRDWIDVITCHEKIQRLGYLAWASCGKDPGFSPTSILAEARRSSHYTDAELAELAFAGPKPCAAALGKSWRHMMEEADKIVESLPPQEAGKCVLTLTGELYRGGTAELREALAAEQILFHEGAVRGSLPQIIG